MDVSGFPHQVGGHFGLLKCHAHVCKPLSQREFAFYLQIDPRLRSFTAKCCGRIKVNLCAFEDGSLAMCTDSAVNCHHCLNEEECGTRQGPSRSHHHAVSPLMTFRVKSGKVEAEKATNLWAGQCQSKVVQKLLKGYDKWFMLLEDVVDGYHQPCVIDLKMGTRQYGDDASAQKRLTQTQKCRQSTSELMGVRMVGMQLYQRMPRHYSYVNKYEGRRMDRSILYAALAKFFCAAGHERMRELVARLEELRAVLKEAESFRFFSSSLLIAYDGDEITDQRPDIEHKTEAKRRQHSNRNIREKLFFDARKINSDSKVHTVEFCHLDTLKNANGCTEMTHVTNSNDCRDDGVKKCILKDHSANSPNWPYPFNSSQQNSPIHLPSSPLHKYDSPSNPKEHMNSTSTFEDSEDGESSLSTVSFSLEEGVSVGCGERCACDSEDVLNNGCPFVGHSDSTATISQVVAASEQSPAIHRPLTSHNIDNYHGNDEIEVSKKNHVKPRITLKMIDFAHSTFDGFLDDECYKGVDEGYLLGVESLIEILRKILAGENIESKESKILLSKITTYENERSLNTKDEGIEVDPEMQPTPFAVEEEFPPPTEEPIQLEGATHSKANTSIPNNANTIATTSNTFNSATDGQKLDQSSSVENNSKSRSENSSLQRLPSKRKMMDNKKSIEPASARQPPRPMENPSDNFILEMGDKEGSAEGDGGLISKMKAPLINLSTEGFTGEVE